MKKLLLGTIVLLAFNAAVILTQMSCKKEAQAETPIAGTPTLKQLDLILYFNNIKSNNGPNQTELWIAKLDGSDAHKVNIKLPDGVSFHDGARLSPDGKTIVFDTFQVIDNFAGDAGIFSCNVDGSNLKKIIATNPTTAYNYLQGVY